MPKAHTTPAVPLTPERGQLLTVQQTAEYLSVVPRTVDRLIVAGQLPSVKIGRARRIYRNDVDAFLEALAS